MISFRKTDKKDLEFLFNLRNEEAVRLASFNSNPISLDAHREWFEKKLNSSDSFIFITEFDGQPIAQVRFDLGNCGEAEINIAVTQSFRGRGHGSEILRRLSRQFLKDFPKIEIIRAFVKPDNPASLRGFEKAGYKIVGETMQKSCKCVEMVFSLKKIV